MWNLLRHRHVLPGRGQVDGRAKDDASATAVMAGPNSIAESQ
jgi:hypothetical protein